MVAQIVLAFFFHIDGLRVIKHVGWIVLMVSGIFGWMPIFTFHRMGGVPKGRSYIRTTVLVDSGIYAIVRHPQFLAGMLINIAIILITQHWLIAIIGVTAMGLGYLDALRADQYLIEKFGDDYRHYMKAVPRMNFLLGLIRLPGYKERRQKEDS